VDDSSDFSSIDYDSGWISENYYAPASIPEGSWYWRVQARDNWGNVGENSERTFDIGVPVWFTGTLARPDNTFVSATIRLYSHSMLRHQIVIGDNGCYNVKIHTGVYDMKISSFDTEITFENLRVFESGTPNQVFENIFQIDNFDVSVTPISGTKARLVAFSVCENVLADNYDRVTITFDYSSHTGEIDNASALTFYRCADWVFEDRTCNGTWTELGGTINLVTRTITITTDTFSAYVVAEKETGTPLSEVVEDLQDTVNDLQSSLSNLSDTVGGLSGSIENLGSSITNLESTVGELSGAMENLPTKEPLTITPSSLSITMYEGEASSGELYIRNNLSSSQTVFAWVENGDSLENFLSFSGSPLSLDSGESGTINFVVYIPMDTPAMMYSGVIKVHSESADVDVPVILRIMARKRNLLDLKVMPLNYEVAPGDVIQTEVYLYNMGDEPKVDTNVLLELVDPRTLEVIARQGEALAVETAMTKTISMVVPEGVEERSYYIRGTAEYLTGLGENVEVVSVASVEVKKPPVEVTFFGLPLGTLLAILVASVASSAVGVGVYRWERRRRKARKRFEDVVSLSELPTEGPDSAWLGYLAETKRRAFMNLDDMKTHVMIAGATGSGKSITAQGIVEEALLRGRNVIVFDPTAQWTGFLRKCKEPNMLKYYGKFGMSESDARGFPGRVKLIRDPRERIDMKALLSEEMKGKITIFVLEGLGPGDMDTFVTNTIQEVFRSQPKESEKLRTLIVYDELHRLLPRFGGEGKGVIQIERGIREFRKWGIGLVLVSQVVSDFEKEIRANIRTQIQMWTREEEELARITEKFGREHMQSISKAPVGFGMMVNSDYNRGKPYYINFKPIRHQVSRLTPEELERYYEGDERIEDVKFKLKKLEEKGVDVFDMKIELDLAEKKLEEGSFDMVDLYLESLEPRVKKACEKHGLKDIKREKVLVTEEELKKAETKAIKEREVYEEKVPEIVEAYREMLAPAAEVMKVGRKIKPFTKKSKTVKRASRRVRVSGKKKVKTVKRQTKSKGRKKSRASRKRGRR
ncbi:MAG TPA: DUF87 domain-containing protein, partial [Hadesarchaea archaeon]|nr:DUF87 domain-containing protein [Hadesarchaea archaeon]